MINSFILSFAILEFIIDIIWSVKYYKLKEENERLKMLIEFSKD